MTIDEFLSELTEVLEADAPLAAGQTLAEVVAWDSLAVLSTLELFEGLGVDADLASIGEAETVDELIALARPGLTG